MKTWTSWDDHMEQTTTSSFIATILCNVFYDHNCVGSFISFATSLSWDLKQLDGRRCAMIAKQMPALFILVSRP